MRWWWGGLVLMGLALVLLAGCGAEAASGELLSSTSTATATAVDDGRETVAEAMRALAIGDQVTLQGLVDPTLGTLGVALISQARADWQAAQSAPTPGSGPAQTLGKVEGWTIPPPETRGQTTLVTVEVRHTAGRADWVFSLARTAQGWRIVNIASGAPAPRPAPVF
jgi:hypothetical protein